MKTKSGGAGAAVRKLAVANAAVLQGIDGVITTVASGIQAMTRAEAKADGDFFQTPRWCVEKIMPYLPQGSSSILDAGCGTGAIMNAIALHDAEQGGAGRDWALTGIELDEGRAGVARGSGHDVITGDFLSAIVPGRFDVVIMNPPFVHAFDFVQHAIDVAPFVAALLLINFAASAKRAPFHRRHPSHMHVLPTRPSFCISVRCASLQNTDLGGRCGYRGSFDVDGPIPKRCPLCEGRVSSSATDAREYAWFVWDSGAMSTGATGRWSVL